MQIAADGELLRKIEKNGLPWMGVRKALEDALPDILEDRGDLAHNNTSRAMDEILGAGGWDTERRDSKSQPGRQTTWIVKK